MTKAKGTRSATLHDKRASLESNLARLYALEDPKRGKKQAVRSVVYDLVLPSTASCSPKFVGDNEVRADDAKEHKQNTTKEIQVFVPVFVVAAVGAENKPKTGKGFGKRGVPTRHGSRMSFYQSSMLLSSSATAFMTL